RKHPALRSIQDSIYVLSTAEGTVSAYKKFIHDYPTNPNYRNAWEQLYLLYTGNGADSAYLAFANDFPDYPDKERLSNDLELSRKDLKPFHLGSKWGYAYQ